jgi:hypothetical protein
MPGRKLKRTPNGSAILREASGGRLRCGRLSAAPWQPRGSGSRIGALCELPGPGCAIRSPSCKHGAGLRRWGPGRRRSGR